MFGVALVVLTRGYNFYFDEWTFILSAPDWNALSYLQPHNMHPAMIPRAICSKVRKMFPSWADLPRRPQGLGAPPI